MTNFLSDTLDYINDHVVTRVIFCVFLIFCVLAGTVALVLGVALGGGMLGAWLFGVPWVGGVGGLLLLVAILIAIAGEFA
jgi:hypothetical protein